MESITRYKEDIRDFTLKNNKGAFVAKATIVNRESKRPGLLVKEGSRMYNEVKITKKRTDCPWIEKSRMELIENKLVDDENEDYYVVNKDVLFSSPNKAACAMLGYAITSAWHEFKNKDDLSLDEVYRKSKES
jgi:hypothetical protein